jgi:hypothetical protein
LFNCGKSRHFIKDCPYPKQNKTNFQQNPGNSTQGKGNTASTSTGKNFKKTGRIYYTQVATTPKGEAVMIGTFLVANYPIVILFDSGELWDIKDVSLPGTELWDIKDKTETRQVTCMRRESRCSVFV